MSNQNHLAFQTSDFIDDLEEFFRKAMKVLAVIYVPVQILAIAVCYNLLEVLTSRIAFHDAWPCISFIIYMNLLPVGILLLIFASGWLPGISTARNLNCWPVPEK